MSYTLCPFCENDPFHYVDNGLGMEAVAVDCCEMGHEYYMGLRHDEPETVVIGWDDFMSIAGKLRRLTKAVGILEQAQSCIMQETPEDMTFGEAEDDTLSKIREFLNAPGT